MMSGVNIEGSVDAMTVALEFELYMYGIMSAQAFNAHISRNFGLDFSFSFSVSFFPHFDSGFVHLLVAR